MVSAGQRPLSFALAFTAPPSVASALAGCSRRHSGVSRSSAGAAMASVQRSALPADGPVAMLPAASSVLPAASSFSTVCSGPLPLWRRLAVPDSGTPASTLARAMSTSALP